MKKSILPLWVKTPRLARELMPEAIWHIPTKEKVLYLTFDDGPIPEATEFTLEQLDKYNAKGTFFCVGENIQKHPQVFRQVISAEHSIGNHTMQHLSGWVSTLDNYLQNVAACEQALLAHGWQPNGTKLFRPPYGRIRPRQYKTLKQQYKVVMWDVLSYDFDITLTGEQVAKSVITHAAPGSVVVLHDSTKAYPRLKIALPKILQHFSKEGWRFEGVDTNYSLGK